MQADAYIYTDGSRKDGHSAAAITSQNYEKTNRLHDSHSIFSAELIAISSALRYIASKHFQKAVICTDSASSVRTLTTRKTETHPLVYKIKKQLIALQKEKKEVRILWIPAHMGIQGNERADNLAKTGLLFSSRNHLPLPVIDFINHIYVSFMQLRQRDWDTIKHPHLYPIKPSISHFSSSNQPTRQKETVLARLRLGHTYLTHSHIYDRVPPPICHYCPTHPRYTIQHFILHCPRLQHHRRHIIRHITTHGLSLDFPTTFGDDYPELHD